MRKYAYIFRVYLQGFFLGILLFIALCELLATSGGARLFRYQGF